jgi:hypothetical protein
LEEFNIDEITIREIDKERETHQFEALTKRIIGAAILVHRELARPPRLSEPLL